MGVRVYSKRINGCKHILKTFLMICPKTVKNELKNDNLKVILGSAVDWFTLAQYILGFNTRWWEVHYVSDTFYMYKTNLVKY